jgi:hypothetical protein
MQFTAPTEGFVIFLEEARYNQSSRANAFLRGDVLRILDDFHDLDRNYNHEQLTNKNSICIL